MHAKVRLFYANQLVFYIFRGFYSKKCTLKLKNHPKILSFPQKALPLHRFSDKGV
jgi:hypothetical protein